MLAMTEMGSRAGVMAVGTWGYKNTHKERAKSIV